MHCQINYLCNMYNEIAILMNAFMLGAMTSFIVVTSPTVFKTLDVENAKNFLRSIFPKLFKFCFLISLLTTLFFVLGNFIYGIILSLLIALSFLFNTYFLTPQINQKRDLSLKGDNNSSVYFKYMHLASVLLYLLNMIFAVFLIIIHYI